MAMREKPAWLEPGRMRFGLRQKEWLPYALIGPALVVTTMIALYPVLTALRTSLFDMNLLRMAEAKFVGLGKLPGAAA